MDWVLDFLNDRIRHFLFVNNWVGLLDVIRHWAINFHMDWIVFNFLDRIRLINMDDFLYWYMDSFLDLLNEILI